MNAERTSLRGPAPSWRPSPWTGSSPSASYCPMASWQPTSPKSSRPMASTKPATPKEPLMIAVEMPRLWPSPSARPMPTCRTRPTVTNPHTPWHTTSPARVYLCHSWHPIRIDRDGHMHPAPQRDGWPDVLSGTAPDMQQGSHRPLRQATRGQALSNQQPLQLPCLLPRQPHSCLHHWQPQPVPCMVPRQPLNHLQSWWHQLSPLQMLPRLPLSLGPLQQTTASAGQG